MADKLTAGLFLRLQDEDVERLDALVDRVPALKRATIAREALRRGMDVLELDPATVLVIDRNRG